MKYKMTAMTVSAALSLNLLGFFPAHAEEATQLVDSGINYTETVETISNPGAGYTSTIWYTCKPGDTPVYNPTGNLVLMFVDIGAFSSGSNGVTADDGIYTEGTDIPLDDAFFTNIRKTLDNCRKNGCTAAMRFRYDDMGKQNPEPSTFEFMMSHIQQIKENGFLSEYQDIIAFVESGFVGAWGEQWGGKYTTVEDKAKVLDAMLDCVPSPIPVTVRTPDIFAKWAGIERSELVNYTPEPGSEASRVGMYDDGYMGSDIDLGTYSDREAETTWLSRQTLTSYFGGEFSGNIEFAKKYDTYLPKNAIPEMYKTHLSYINSNIFTLYQDYIFGTEYDVPGADNSAYYGQTVFQFIRDHLGYRFVLRDSDLSAEVKQGESLELNFAVENTGFANPIMPEKAEIMLEKDGNYIKTEAEIDTSKWYSCTTSENDLQLKLPGGLETGNWNVYLKLSVGNNTLDQMGMRSVHFANQNVWNASLGANYLGTFCVTENEDTAELTNGTFYQSNTDAPISVSNGEMYTVNGLVSSESISDAYLVKEAGDKKLYLSNDENYFYITAIIPQNASSPVYNLQIKPETSDKTYWLYYQSNGFVYFNNGTPVGCTCIHDGDMVQFRVPLGELMEVYPKTTLSSVRVSIQDEADSWKNVGEIKSDEYTVTEYFSVYSGKQKVYLNSGDTVTLQPLTYAENLKYQWLFNNEPIDGAVHGDYIVTAKSPGTYSVQMTTEMGTIRAVDIFEVVDVFEPVIRGDINLDGTFSIADIVLMQGYLLCLAEIDQQQFQRADVNADAQLNAFDLVLMRQMLIEKVF